MESIECKYFLDFTVFVIFGLFFKTAAFLSFEMTTNNSNKPFNQTKDNQLLRE